MADNKAAGDATAGNKKKMLLIGAAVGVVVLLVGVFAGVMLGGGKQEAEVAAQPLGPPPAIYASLGDKFVTVLQHEGKQRYFQVSISAMSREEAAIKALETHAPLIRGRLVSLLGRQNFAELRTEEGKVALRESVLSEVQELLTAETGSPGVEQIFFTEFVLQ